jgi:hypothetical protein
MCHDRHHHHHRHHPGPGIAWSSRILESYAPETGRFLHTITKLHTATAPDMNSCRQTPRRRISRRREILDANACPGFPDRVFAFTAVTPVLGMRADTISE